MSHTNSTANLSLPQFIGTDKPTWLSDVNGAFAAIDAYAGSNDAALAITDGKADTAIADASNAVTTAGNAATTAGNAAATATNANTVAGNALTIVNNTVTKMGDPTNLVTTDKSSLVAAINEVAGYGAPAASAVSYDNAGSGLTATNVQDAIDEVAQGGGGLGAWTLIGSETGTNPIDISGSTATEFYIIIKKTNDVYLSLYVPAAALDATTRYLRQGYYASAGACAAAAVGVSTAAIATFTLNINGNDSTASAEILVYSR